MDKKVVKVLMRISLPWILNNQKLPIGNRGFTLIELMVVVALIALITSLALPGLSSYFRVSINSLTREMASTVREAYNSAMITGKVHRLAIDLTKNTYWVEVGPRTHLLHTPESKEKEERLLSWFSEDEKKKSPFRIEESITKEALSLPSDVEFKEITTEKSEDPINDGMAYIHFFPNGITEQSIIHIQDEEENEVSLIISALVGKTTVENRYVSKEEAFEIQ